MHISSFSSQYWKKFGTSILLIFWVLGSALGFLFGMAGNTDYSTVIRNAVLQPQSLSGILVVALLPFLIGTLAVSCSEFWVLPVLGGIKAFAFSFIACIVSVTFGQSSWLIYVLLLFSDMLLVPVFCVFCLRYISGNQALLRREWCIWFLVAILVGCLDYCFISPFLVSLF